MKLPSRKTLIPLSLSMLACLINTSTSNFHMSCLIIPQQEIENFINNSLLVNLNLMTTKHSSSVLFTTLTSLQTLSAIFSSYIALHLSHLYGRKKVLFLIGPSLAVSGSVLICLAWPFNRVGLLFLGRIICGLSTGISYTIVPVYIAEISPASLRGILGSLISPGAAIGFFAGMIASLPGVLGSPDSLPYLHAIPASFAGLGIIFYFWAVESPRYLSLIKHQDEKCRHVLKHLGISAENVEDIIAEYHREHEDKEKRKPLGISAAFRVPFYRATIFLTTFFSISYGMTGIHGLVACLVEFLTEIGMEHSVAQHFGAIGFAIADLASSLISPIPVHFFPRKKILFATCSIILLSLGVMFILILLLDLHVILNGKVVAYFVTVLFLIQTISHDLGPCTITFIIPPEISTTDIRSLTCALSNIFRSLSLAFSQFYFYPLFLKISAYSLLPFMLIMFSTIFVIVKFLPETGGLTVTEAVWKWRAKCEKIKGNRKNKKNKKSTTENTTHENCQELQITRL